MLPIFIGSMDILKFFTKEKKEESKPEVRQTAPKAGFAQTLAVLDYYKVKDYRQLEMIIRKHYSDNEGGRAGYPMMIRPMLTAEDRGVTTRWK